MNTQKILYFSGVHGIGKTQIIREIKENNYIRSATFIDLDEYYKYPKDYVGHQMKRINVGYESWKASSYAPITIVDRSPYNPLLYSETLYEFGLISEDQFNMIHNTFHMLPENYRVGGYIIFLNPSIDRIMENIAIRDRENESKSILGQRDFIESLHGRYERFYDQLHKVRHVATFDNKDCDYTAHSIIKDLQRRCWLQSHELDPELRDIEDKYGLYSKICDVHE